MSSRRSILQQRSGADFEGSGASDATAVSERARMRKRIPLEALDAWGVRTQRQPEWNRMATGTVIRRDPAGRLAAFSL